MRKLLGSAMISVGLAACSRTPPTVESRARPPAEPSTPPVAPSARPAADESAAPSTPENDGGRRKHGRPGGSKCEYDIEPGMATVVSIKDEPGVGADCKHAKKVTLTFAPDNPAAKPMPLDKAFDLSVGGAGFVPAGCLKEFHISVGAKLRVERRTETAGGCSPFIYQVMTLSAHDDIRKCVAYCL